MNYRTQSFAGRTGLVAMAVVIAIGLTTPAIGWATDTEQAQTSWAEVGEAAPTQESRVVEKYSGGFKIQYQVGFWYRLGGYRDAAEQDPWLFTIDLVGLVWDREHATWGLGGHLAYDSDGMRVGLKGLWRIPLGLSSASFLQISPGIYVYATDENTRYDYSTTWQGPYGVYLSEGKLDLPAFFCEAELGITDYFSLLTALEVLPFTWSTRSSYGEPSSAGSHTETLDWNWYVGAKLGQAPGIIATVLLGVGVAATAAVLASSGGIGFGY